MHGVAGGTCCETCWPPSATSCGCAAWATGTGIGCAWIGRGCGAGISCACEHSPRHPNIRPGSVERAGGAVSKVLDTQTSGQDLSRDQGGQAGCGPGLGWYGARVG